MSKVIDSKFMKKFVKTALDRLEGEWIIIGGTVLPLFGVDLRATVDIDMISLGSKASNKSSLALMEMAESLGLPVEAINQAGAYFLSKISDVNQHLILFQKSERCKIYTPDSFLFIKLKIARLSQSDYDDCIEFAKLNADDFAKNKKAILTALKTAMKTASPHIKERLIELQNQWK